MKLGWKLLLVLSLSLNVGLLGVGIFRAIAEPKAWDTASDEFLAENTDDLEPESAPDTLPTPAPPAPELDMPAPGAAPMPAHPRHPAFARAMARHGAPGMRAARQWPQRRLVRLERALQLTGQQRRQLESQLTPLHDEIQSISAHLAQARALLFAQMAADRVDPGEARRLQARLSQAQARLDSLVTEAMLREHGVLDARQRHLHSQMLRSMAAQQGGRGRNVSTTARRGRAHQGEDEEDER